MNTGPMLFQCPQCSGTASRDQLLQNPAAPRCPHCGVTIALFDQETMFERYKPLLSPARVPGGYGTTTEGGTHTNCGGENIGCGTVFELSPGVDRKWTETVLQNFSKRGNAGNKPHVGLAFDSAGNLYGANLQGGALRRGTVFELIHRANGRWRTKVLHSFADNEGMNPLSTPIFDDVGNLYGITTNGGSFQVGTVFELKPRADGEWTETTLHTFLSGGTDGGYPVGLHRDIVGHLYGVTFEGGTGSSCYPSACGTVFEVSPK